VRTDNLKSQKMWLGRG